MKRLLIAAILPVIFFSCAKEEITNPAFRAPTCADTTDDGVFEAFTAPEKVELLRHFKYVPDTEFHYVMRQNTINDRTIHNRGVDYNPYITYQFYVPAKVFAWVPIPNQPEKYYSWVVNAPDTASEYKVNLYQLRQLSPQLQAGCYRVYYVVSTSDTGIVYSKGHYDLQIKN